MDGRWSWKRWLGKKRLLVIASLLLVVVAAVHGVYTFWVAQAGDRPTLVYFYADL